MKFPTNRWRYRPRYQRRLWTRTPGIQSPPPIDERLEMPMETPKEMRRRLVWWKEAREFGRRRGDCGEGFRHRRLETDDADESVEDLAGDHDDDDDPTKAAPSSPWRRPKKRAAS